MEAHKMKKILFVILFALLSMPMVFAASVTRTASSEVGTNQNIQITLTATGTSGNYFVIVRDNIPIGWTYVSGGPLEGSQVKGFLTSIGSSTITYILKSPSSSATSTFTGTYQFSDAANPSQ